VHVLKQSTAATVTVGPVLDAAGAVYNSAVIGDFNIVKNGTSAALASPATATLDTNGHYLIALATGNTDTVGRLTIICNKAGYVVTPARYTVLLASVFDALITNATTAAGGLGDIQRMAGTVLTARDIGASILLSPGTGTGQVSLSSGAVLLQPTQTGVTIPTVTNLTNAPTAGDFTATMKTSITTAATAATPTISLGSNAPAGWLNAAAFASAALNGKGDWNTTTPPTASANAIATWDLARSGHTTAGTFGEAANAIVASDAYTGGTAQAGASTTITLASDAPSFTIPSGNGGFLIVLISGTGVGQQATITAYNTSSKVATIAGTWKTTPDSTTVYRIYFLTATTADSVLDELVADHTITGSAGKAFGYLTGDAYVQLASGVVLASDGLDAIVIETGVNARQALSPILASACGVLSGAPATSGGTIVIKNPAASVTRITTLVDGAGNRIATTLNLPA
jgi:hypothetical protein